jgi:hypothetical protein
MSTDRPLEEAAVSNMWEIGRIIMIKWVPYNDHNIKVCAQSLADARWLPLAPHIESVRSQELLTTVNSESTEISKSCKEADRVALRKAKRWIDQNR